METDTAGSTREMSLREGSPARYITHRENVTSGIILLWWDASFSHRDTQDPSQTIIQRLKHDGGRFWITG